MELDRLLETITVPRTDPIYNCHAYLTKVPVGAIQPFIETFTEPGDVVVDFFAGSGMTGLAAFTVGRRARLSDISVLGQHIANGYLKKVSAAELLKAAHDVTQKAREAIGTLYMSKRASDGEKVELVRVVWSFTYTCPACSSEMVYFEHLNEKGAPPAHCPACNEPFARRHWARLDDVPVRVVVRAADGQLTEQKVSAFDWQKLREAGNDKRLSEVPSQTIEKYREMYSRSGLGKAGMTETRDFFSPRNSIALLELWRAINEVENVDIRQKLRFAFTAILPRASRRYQWGVKRPLNAQNQTYYIAPVYYEWNVFELFARKVNAAIKATDSLFGRGSSLFGQASLLEEFSKQDVTYEITSANRLKHLDDESIDYVFTDPPFGSNIFYSDMNLFYEAWLGEITDHTSEAVVYTTGNRKNGAEERYRNLLRDAFKEGWRVLKPGKYMSVVFGNSSGRIWGLVQQALRDAGFIAAPVHVAILDKGQRSVKGLNSGSEGVVTVDLIVTVRKPAKGEDLRDTASVTDGDTEKLVVETIKELSTDKARNPSHVYARILQKAIKKHLRLDDLHLSDVLISLRNAGYLVDHKSGLFYREDKRRVA